MRFKRIISFLLALILMIGICSFFNVSSASSITVRPDVERPYDLEDGAFAVRDDFYWGIGIHGSDYPSYPAEYLEQHIHLVANSGCEMIRIGLRLEDDMTQIDKTIELCNAYGLTVLGVFKPSTEMGLDYITMAFETICTRYNGENGRGKIHYIQAWNETDNILSRARNGGSSSTDGTKLEYYYTIPVEGAADLPEYLEYFLAAQKGIENSGSDVKFMTNFAYKHYAPHRYYLDNGVKFDAIGWDWYAHFGTYEEAKAECEDICDQLYEAVIKDYPDIEVIICETNTSIENIDDWKNPRFEEWFPVIAIMETMYSKPWIKGLSVYELLDEMQYASSAKPREALFGFVTNDISGNVGEPKDIYHEYQRLIGGDGNTKLIPETTVDLSPYAALKVDTADDSSLKSENDETDTDVETDADKDEDKDININTDDVQSESSMVQLPNENPQQTDSIVENTSSNEDTITNDILNKQEIKTPIKQINTTQTAYEIPWLFIIIGSAVLLLLFVVAVVVFVIIDKKKTKNKSLVE